ncbi:7019_t:CDS:2, partial [Funneliformis geosporum]
MARPISPEFDPLTYPQYFERYLISPSRPLTNRSIFHDQLNNYVVKQSKEIIDLMKHTDKNLSLFPDFLTTLQIQTTNNHHSHITYLNNQFAEILDRLLQSLYQELTITIQDIIRLQLENIKMFLT